MSSVNPFLHLIIFHDWLQEIFLFILLEFTFFLFNFFTLAPSKHFLIKIYSLAEANELTNISENYHRNLRERKNKVEKLLRG